MLRVDSGNTDGQITDVGLAHDQYLRFIRHPQTQAVLKQTAEAEKERGKQLREAAVLAGLFLVLFAAERIFGKEIAARKSASGGIVSATAKAAAA